MQYSSQSAPRIHLQGKTFIEAAESYLKHDGEGRYLDRLITYSLRHTFQDRIENAGASDRMQADLMGHEFGRPTYGDGAEMKRRQAFLQGIALPWRGKA